MEVSSRAVYVLFNNCTAQDTHVPKANHLGWLISQAFHDFELMVPVIGPIPTQLMSDEYDGTVTFTKPNEIIAITSILPVSRESVCRSELTDDTHLAVYAVSTQPATESPTHVTTGAQSPSNDLTAEEPYAGFNAQVQQILSEADANKTNLHNEADRQGLKEVLHKYKNSFAKDSLDCGLTNIHTVRIPTNPNAPPTFVRQYKIPIASYEPMQEIVDSMLEKGVIRPCNSTYSAPIWPVLKPNGKWQPTIDYRKLNQQVPFAQENNSIWPLDFPIIVSAQAYTSSMTKTNEWSLMPAKRCFPQNASTQTAKRLCFALCGLSSVSLITSVHRKSSSRLVISRSPS